MISDNPVLVPPPDIFFNLLRHADALVGNSSAGIREAAYFGTPVVNIGTRQEGREHGRNVMHAECDKKDIALALRTQLAHGHYEPEYLYGDGTAGKKISNTLKTINTSFIQKKLTY